MAIWVCEAVVIVVVMLCAPVLLALGLWNELREWAGRPAR